MSWNHRLTELNGVLSIREVYYDGECNDDPCSCPVSGWTDPLTLDGYEKKEWLRNDLKRMLEALDKPSLFLKGEA